jgi:alpha-amylase
MADVILHAFNWTYESIAARAEEIARIGYGAVLFPPPLYSDEKVADWWQRYQPIDYRVVRSQLGNKAQLTAAMDALRRVGVRSYADIVFNHMANEFGLRPEPMDFPGKERLQRYAAEAAEFEQDRLYGNLTEPLFDERSFHPKIGIDDWMDSDAVAQGWLGGLPDLTLSVWVVKQQLACLAALNTLGFDGYRVDAIKHLPDQHIQSVFNNPVLKDKFVFGEILTFNDWENSVYLWPALQESTMSFYDFPLQQTLRRAFSLHGSLRELSAPARHGRALPWDRAVTFTVTHDVPNNDGFRGMILDAQDEYLANAYVLGRDGGVPMVYSDNSESALQYPSDEGRWRDLWNRADVAAMVRFHNALHGCPQRSLVEHDGVFVFTRGDRGIVAINKTGDWQTIALHGHGMAWGHYRCELHGYEMKLDCEPFTLSVPPRQAQLWLRRD